MIVGEQDYRVPYRIKSLSCISNASDPPAFRLLGHMVYRSLPIQLFYFEQKVNP